MKPLQIGLIGPRHDDEVLTLSRALRAEGVRPRVIDLTGLPGAHRLELRDEAPYYNDSPLDALDAFYLRRLRFALDERPLLEAAAHDEERWLAMLDEHIDQRRREAELEALIGSALSLVEAPIVNELEAQQVHPRKAHHLRQLAAGGAPVPPMVATNDPAALERQVARFGDDGALIKPLRSGLKTKRFDPALAADLSRRPAMVQRHVHGVTVRVYAVAGQAVAAAELHNEGHVDSSVAPRPALLTELTEAEHEAVRRATRATALVFTGMDLLRPAAGGVTQVLECNAAPMFANFCRRTGADVATPLARYLIHRARGGAAWERGPR